MRTATTKPPRTALASLLIGASILALGAPALAQDVDFKKLIEQGRYKELGKKIEKQLVLEKSDEKLRAYLKLHLDYLKRGAKPRVPGSEIILVRGAKNDRLYQMPNKAGKKKKDGDPNLFKQASSYASGGPRLMLPNRIRYLHMAWDKRLTYFDRYFREATTLLGGDGDDQRELEKIITHHKGGGLGTNANSVKSVLISASTRPLWAFGPPYYIIKIAPERCIFNWKGLSGEFEVLIPFYVLPHEIAARCDSREEVENHPLYQQSKLKDVAWWSNGYGSDNNWVKIENNIRNGRPPLPLGPEDDGQVIGRVELKGKRVCVRDGDQLYRITDKQTARLLKPFSGKKVRLKGTATAVDDITLDLAVDEVLSPQQTSLEAEVLADYLKLADGDLLQVEGSPARGLKLVKGKVKVKGWLFSHKDDEPYLIKLTAIEAKAAAKLKLRRPLGYEVPAGEAVTIVYVSSTTRSAIVRHGTGWGWVKTKDLTVGAPASVAPGIVGAVPN